MLVLWPQRRARAWATLAQVRAEGQRDHRVADAPDHVAGRRERDEAGGNEDESAAAGRCEHADHDAAEGRQPGEDEPVEAEDAPAEAIRRRELEDRLARRRPERRADARREEKDEHGWDRVEWGDGNQGDAEADDGRLEPLPRRRAGGGRDERAGEGADAEARVQEPEQPGPMMEGAGGECGQRDAEVEACNPDDLLSPGGSAAGPGCGVRTPPLRGSLGRPPAAARCARAGADPPRA